ncbi:unnamed protein product [Ectocarpus sp. CCAP 1310/34]|nr:unnamed protein product [Ectocarpus sp. CCAP 1310/34]
MPQNPTLLARSVHHAEHMFINRHSPHAVA